MKFNLLEFVREKLDLTKFGINVLNQEKLEIYSLKNGVRYPKSLILPSKLVLDENLSELIGLYIGDGDFNAKNSSHTSFISIDEDLVSFFFRTIKERFGINENKMTLMINYSSGNPISLKENWSRILGANDFKFRKSIRSRNDALLIQINSKIFSILFKELILHLLPSILKNEVFRRGFLRGYFSADGGIAVKHDPIRLNLSQITFNYNAKNESWLRNFVISCLEKENIENISYSENGSEGFISIYNWNNYLKFWRIGIFEGNLRKRNKFLNVVKEMQIYLNLRKSFRENIFNQTGLKQKEIANLINSWQGNVSKTIKGVHLLNIYQINTLINYTNNTWNQVLENSTQIRIGSKTFLPVEHEFMKFVLSNKNLI